MGMETSTGLKIGVGAFIILEASALGIFFGKTTERNDGDQRVQDVQLHNAQIGRQLARDFDINNDGHLVLDDESDTFKFTRTNGEQCSGDYEVRGEKAHWVGNVACTTQLASTQSQK